MFHSNSTDLSICDKSIGKEIIEQVPPVGLDVKTRPQGRPITFQTFLSQLLHLRNQSPTFATEKRHCGQPAARRSPSFVTRALPLSAVGSGSVTSLFTGGRKDVPAANSRLNKLISQTVRRLRRRFLPPAEACGGRRVQLVSACFPLFTSTRP